MIPDLRREINVRIFTRISSMQETCALLLGFIIANINEIPHFQVVLVTQHCSERDCHCNCTNGPAHIAMLGTSGFAETTDGFQLDV